MPGWLIVLLIVIYIIGVPIVFAMMQVLVNAAEDDNFFLAAIWPVTVPMLLVIGFFYLLYVFGHYLGEKLDAL